MNKYQYTPAGMAVGINGNYILLSDHLATLAEKEQNISLDVSQQDDILRVLADCQVALKEKDEERDALESDKKFLMEELNKKIIRINEMEKQKVVWRKMLVARKKRIDELEDKIKGMVYLEVDPNCELAKESQEGT